MKQQFFKFCLNCSTKALSSWKGWPHKKKIPNLPKLDSGICATCGSSEILNSTSINWFNYHSEGNSGLPDYWLLQINEERYKWGFPYFSTSECPRCKKQAVVSQMCYPNGKVEFKTNCSSCGIRNVT